MYNRIFIGMLLFVALLLAGPLAVKVLAADPTQKSQKSDKGATTTSIKDEIKASEDLKAGLTPAQKKIGSDLLQLVHPEFLPEAQTLQSHVKVMQDLNQLSGISLTNGGDSVASGQAYVYVWLQSGTNIHAVDSLLARVEGSDVSARLVTAWVNLSNVEQLAAQPGVRTIMSVSPPEVNTGSVISQGDAVHRADLVRSSLGVDGTGKKVGIISDGVDNWADSKAQGDLPASFDAAHVLSNSRGGNEGTAMLEIVHDLAPGAELYFHDSGTDWLGFNSAIDDLVKAGCTVVCDDIAWTTVPFFEDGVIANHIKEKLGNIVYVTSADNFAQRHYQGQFYPLSSDPAYHDASNNGSDPWINIDIPGNSSASFVLGWSETWGAASHDYDLYLCNRSTGAQLLSSVASQSGSGNPIEVINCNNNGAGTAEVSLKIKAYNNAAKNDPKTLELFSFRNDLINHGITEDSIFGHPAVPGVVACGAVYQGTPNNIESFSCQGPVTMLSETRQKPDVCGVDGVDTYVGQHAWGINPFYGTSASAPHVAAITALIWSQTPALSPAQVKNAICSTAVDLGEPGYDNIYGFGRADAVNAMATGGPVTDLSLLASPADSQLVNNEVTLTANATGGTSPQYEFWVKPEGSAWQRIKHYSTANTCTWTTTEAGNYIMWVDAHSTGSSSIEKSASLSYLVSSSSLPVTGLSLSASPVGSQTANNEVTLTATATGGTGPQYEFWVKPEGGAWQKIRNYSTVNTCTWTPTTTGNYTLWVDAHATGSSSVEKSASLSYTVSSSLSPVTGLSLSASPDGSQIANNEVTLTATATGGTGPQYEFWIKPEGGAWQKIRDYSTVNTCTWTPTATGTYTLWVDAHSTGSSTIEKSASLSYTINAASLPVTGLSFSVSPAGSQTVNNAVTLTATATGGTNPQYEFWIKPAGGAWQRIREYSTVNTCTWTPTATGTYTLWVDAHSTGSSSIEKSASLSYTINPSASAITGLSLLANPAGSQTVNSSVTLTATATGGTSPQYEFWIKPDGGAWQKIRNYSTVNTCTWTPTVAANYTLWVDARSTGSSSVEKSASLSYTINPSASAITGLSLLANPAGSQTVNSSVTLTATATGGTSPQYEFWIKPDGGAWQRIRDYTTVNTCTWTPTAAATYTLWVDARSTGSSSIEKSAFISYTVNAAAAISALSLTASPAGSQSVNNQIILTATAAGGTSPQYEFWVKPDGGAWVKIKDFATANTCTWTPSASGTYTLWVGAHSTGSSTTYEQTAQISYLVTGSVSTYRAILIGNYDYPGTESDLQGPGNDVAMMSNRLSSFNLNGTTFSSIDNCLNYTKTQLMNKLASYNTICGSGDVIYFYYSGHGSYSSGVAYLCTVNDASYYSDWVSVSDLQNALGQIPGTKVVLLDSCHSGGFINQSPSQTPVTHEDIENFNNAVIAAFSAGDGSRYLTGGSYKVITACSGSQSSWEASINGTPRGLFTYYLGRGWGFESSSLLADSDYNNRVTLTESYNYVYPLTSGDQTTKVYPVGGDSTVIFALNGSQSPPVTNLETTPPEIEQPEQPEPTEGPEELKKPETIGTHMN